MRDTPETKNAPDAGQGIGGNEIHTDSNAGESSTMNTVQNTNDTTTETACQRLARIGGQPVADIRSDDLVTADKRSGWFAHSEFMSKQAASAAACSETLDQPLSRHSSLMIDRSDKLFQAHAAMRLVQGITHSTPHVEVVRWASSGDKLTMVTGSMYRFELDELEQFIAHAQLLLDAAREGMAEVER
ncbi:hypothetical protein [Prescottella equi]